VEHITPVNFHLLIICQSCVFATHLIQFRLSTQNLITAGGNKSEFASAKIGVAALGIKGAADKWGIK